MSTTDDGARAAMVRRALALANACDAWVRDMGDCHRCTLSTDGTRTHERWCPVGKYAKAKAALAYERRRLRARKGE